MGTKTKAREGWCGRGVRANDYGCGKDMQCSIANRANKTHKHCRRSAKIKFDLTCARCLRVLRWWFIYILHTMPPFDEFKKERRSIPLSKTHSTNFPFAGHGGRVHLPATAALPRPSRSSTARAHKKRQRQQRERGPWSWSQPARRHYGCPQGAPAADCVPGHAGAYAMDGRR